MRFMLIRMVGISVVGHEDVFIKKYQYRLGCNFAAVIIMVGRWCCC